MNKQQMLEEYQEIIASGKEISMVVLLIEMPTGEVETISNPDVAGKMAYIEDAYDDDLHHRLNPAVHITDVIFHCMDDCTDFGTALAMVKVGRKATRKGWNGKGMYIFLDTTCDIHTEADLSDFVDVGEECKAGVEPVICMRTADGWIQPGWLASQSDMLSEDWEILEDEADTLAH